MERVWLDDDDSRQSFRRQRNVSKRDAAANELVHVIVVQVQRGTDRSTIGVRPIQLGKKIDDLLFRAADVHGLFMHDPSVANIVLCIGYTLDQPDRVGTAKDGFKLLGGNPSLGRDVIQARQAGLPFFVLDVALAFPKRFGG